MPVPFVIAAFVVVAAVALLAVGRLGELPPEDPQRPPQVLPPTPMSSADVERVRFGVGMRGYRMDEVDEVLDRLTGDLAERDARIQLLRRQLEVHGLDPYAGLPADVAPEAVGPMLPFDTEPTAIGAVSPGAATLEDLPAGPRVDDEPPGGRG